MDAQNQLQYSNQSFIKDLFGQAERDRRET